jgi:heparinase II/III-like protein
MVRLLVFDTFVFLIPRFYMEETTQQEPISKCVSAGNPVGQACRNRLILTHRAFRDKAIRAVFSACSIAVALNAAGCSRKGSAPAKAAPEILAKIQTAHPRLMWSSDTMARLKAGLENDPWIKKRYARQIERADRFLTEPAGTYVLKGTDLLLDTSRQVFDRVSTLALVYRIGGDKKYLDRCWAELDSAAHFRDWDSGHFLSTAEMTAGFALGYDWLYDAWTESQRQTIRRAIVDLGLTPGLAVYRSGQRWPTWDNNWNIVGNCGLALGALAVADESPEIAGEVLARGLASAPRCISQFAPDGAWGEGPMYWENATLFTAMYLDALKTACGTEFGLGEMAGLDQSGWFPDYLNGPAGGAFNFADAIEDCDPRAGPQLFWLARRFHEPRYAEYEIEYHTGRLSAFELIWGAGVEHQPWRTIEPDRYFRGVEVATMRDAWNDPRGWFVAFKAGTNTVDHAHLDVGTFILEAKGVRWVIDLGPDDYDLPGYSHEADQRWTYYRLRAEGHNTLAVNPGAGADQNHLGSGKITSFQSSPSGVELSADLTGVYPGADRVVRSLAFVRGKSVRVSDAIKLRGSGEIWWFLQTRAHARPSSDGRTVILSQAGETLELQLVQPITARFEVGPAEPLPGSPHPPKQAINQGVTRIAVHIAGAKETPIEVLFQE